MGNPEEYWDLAERYVNRQLSEDESEEVERLLASDSDFRAAVRIEQSLGQAAKNHEALAFRKTVEGIAKDEKEEASKPGTYAESNLTTQRKPNPKIFWYTAASLALIVAIAGILYYQITQGRSGDDIFYTYYSGYAVESNNREYPDDLYRLSEGLKLYDRNEFEKAAATLIAETDVTGSDEKLLFYLGMAYMETKRYDAAQEVFENILSHPEMAFYDQAKWFTALLLLKENRKSRKAVQLLRETARNNTFKATEAAGLLQELHSR